MFKRVTEKILKIDIMSTEAAFFGFIIMVILAGAVNWAIAHF